jgi:short-subunit dehydrogenase
MPQRELALVTGASGGLGLEFARLLAREGFDLALVARSGDKLTEIARDLEARHGVNVATITADLSVLNAADGIFARIPRCDVLINNAGFASNGRFEELPEQRIREEILLDVLTLTELTRKYLPGMLERRAGRVLNVASTAAFLPGPFMAVYYAAKAYVLSFSEALAEEMRGRGVTVTCLCPGATETGFADRANVKHTLLFKLPRASAAAVVRAGYRGLMHGKALVIPGVSNKLVAISPRFSPRGLLVRVSRALVEQ